MNVVALVRISKEVGTGGMAFWQRSTFGRELNAGTILNKCSTFIMFDVRYIFPNQVE